MSYQVNEQVRALYNGEWHTASIHEVEGEGVYTVLWDTATGNWVTKGYVASELVSVKWRDILENKESENELRNALNQLYERMESSTQTDLMSVSSLESSDWSDCDEGFNAAKEMLDRFAEQKQHAERRELASALGEEVQLTDEMWYVVHEDGASCYWMPDASGEVAHHWAHDEVLVALQMYEVEGQYWIALENGMWVSAEQLAPLDSRQHDSDEEAEPQLWKFDRCWALEQLARRAQDRAIDNALYSDPEALPTKALTALEQFFPNLAVRQNFRSIQEVCGLGNYKWGDASCGRAALNYCLGQLWADLRATVDLRAMPSSDEPVMNIRLLRFLVRQRFDCSSAEFMRYVLRTGKIRVSNYLYIVGPPINKEWTKELAKGVSTPLLKAKPDVMYDNIRALLKFGYRLPLERVISQWKRCKHVKFTWPHDRALRTFKIAAKRERSSVNRCQIVREALTSWGMPTGVESLVLGYVNDFKYYENAVGDEGL